MISTQRILAQTFKELNQFRRDKLTLGLAFVLPMLALLMYGFATRLEIREIPVSIFNFDRAIPSRQLVDRIFATNQLIPASQPSPDPLRPLDFGNARAGIIIPPDFSRALYSGRKADYQAIIDGTDVNNARVIANALLATTNFYMQTREETATAINLIVPRLRLWFNPGRDEALYIVPGSLALNLWVFPALLATLALAREKEQGTILQVYASNLTTLEFISGKTLAYLLIGCVEGLLLTLAALTVFKLQFAVNPIPYFFNGVLYVLSGVLFGLFAATRASTQMAAVQLVANVGFMGAMLLSGFIYPVRNIPHPFDLAAYAVPSFYFMQVSRNAFVRGGDWLTLWFVPALLALMSGALLLLCLRMKLELSQQ